MSKSIAPSIHSITILTEFHKTKNGRGMDLSQSNNVVTQLKATVDFNSISNKIFSHPP